MLILVNEDRWKRDASVVVSTGTPGALDGLLTRIDPTRSAATPRKIRIGLTLRSFQTGVARFRAAARRSGTTAVLRLPRAARVRIQLTLPNGRRYPKVRSVLFDGSAPAGTSYVRVLAGSSARSGKGVLHVQVGGKRPIEVAFKVRLTGEPTRT